MQGNLAAQPPPLHWLWFRGALQDYFSQSWECRKRLCGSSATPRGPPPRGSAAVGPFLAAQSEEDLPSVTAAPRASARSVAGPGSPGDSPQVMGATTPTAGFPVSGNRTDSPAATATAAFQQRVAGLQRELMTAGSLGSHTATTGVLGHGSNGMVYSGACVCAWWFVPGPVVDRWIAPQKSVGEVAGWPGWPHTAGLACVPPGSMHVKPRFEPAIAPPFPAGLWRGLDVAIKVLLVVSQDGPDGREAQQRQRAVLEAAISSALQHPNVVATYAHEVQPLAAAPAAHHHQQQQRPHEAYKLYLVQELCNGGSLQDALGEAFALHVRRAAHCMHPHAIERPLASIDMQRLGLPTASGACSRNSARQPATYGRWQDMLHRPEARPCARQRERHVQRTAMHITWCPDLDLDAHDMTCCQPPTLLAWPVCTLAYAIGAGLAGRLGAGGAWPRLALRLAAGIASGLAHIHAHGIVHGDLSPANVLLVWSQAQAQDAAEAQQDEAAGQPQGARKGARTHRINASWPQPDERARALG